MHLDAWANGLGAQSLVGLILMCRREIPGTVSLTADTGWEFDRLWSNGRRASARVYFDEVVKPYASRHEIDARFVRSVDKNGVELPDLGDYTAKVAASGNFKGLNIPMFGSRKGRVTQRCTDKMKIRACRQEARKMGAKTMTIGQGIHIGEASRRVSGFYLYNEGKWSIYQTTIDAYRNEDQDGKTVRVKYKKPIKWLKHFYPLVDLGLNRNDCQRMVVSEKLPYIISSECDGCPHKDLPRWERTSPDVIARLAKLESQFNGEFFFTDERIPLLEAIAKKQEKRAANPEKYKTEADFGCENSFCGI